MSINEYAFSFLSHGQEQTLTRELEIRRGQTERWNEEHTRHERRAPRFRAVVIRIAHSIVAPARPQMPSTPGTALTSPSQQQAHE
jgi:hypothetical protein